MKNIALAVFLLVSINSFSQNILPDFSVVSRGKGRTIVSWTNSYPVVTQISIQRSFDSLRNYKTILTVPDPRVLQNGFVDTKAPTEFQFYRLFIVLDSGKYFFTKAKRPILDTSKSLSGDPAQINIKSDNGRVISDPGKLPNQPGINQPVTEPVRMLFVKKGDSIVIEIPENNLKSLRDSILYKTKDTLVFRSVDTLLIKPFVPKEIYKPSIYVFTGRDGNVTVALPQNSDKKYQVKFFEEDHTPLFELKEVKQSPLTLDKSNFLHSGWFRFELYENGVLREKHRFYIPKDF